MPLTVLYLQIFNTQNYLSLGGVTFYLLNSRRLVCKFSGLSQQLWVPILSQIETVMTYVSFIGRGFLNSMLSNPIESGKVGIKFSMPLIWLVVEHDATMQPHFDPSVFRNLNFSVFDLTETISSPFSGFKGKKWLCCRKIHFRIHK